MNKLREFARTAIFYVRVLSGYEERRIRSQRLQLQQRVAQVEKQQAETRKIPEQIILSQVRKMVEDMQALNKELEETARQVDNIFKPLDKKAESLMKEQLDGEEKTMKELVKVMRNQALYAKTEAEEIAVMQLKNSQIAKSQYMANIANQENNKISPPAPTWDQVR